MSMQVNPTTLAWLLLDWKILDKCSLCQLNFLK
jgi:hypothetical protein